jgi:hypothetical protein
VFPHLGPEWIESFLGQSTRPKDRLNRALPAGRESGPSTEDKASGTQRRKTKPEANKMEDYDD